MADQIMETHDYHQKLWEFLGEFSTNHISQLSLSILFARNAAIYCLAIFIAIMLIQIGGSDLNYPHKDGEL